MISREQEKEKNQNKKNKMKKRGVGRIVLSIVAVLLGLLLLIGVGYCYQCMHYWQGDLKRTMKAGFVEKQIKLPDGSVINYAEGPQSNDKSALLLIHGQTGAWEDYARVLPQLSKTYHVFAVDCYGHGKSSHNEKKYYLKDNGDDLIWFVKNVINENTIVSGHSSGGLLAAYVAAYGGDKISGAVLEDPPVFSTEPDYFQKTFAYQDTYKLMHEYRKDSENQCWEAYYMRHCLWGQMYMSNAMDGLANYAQKYFEKHSDKPVQYFFMPESINFMFLYTQEYDNAFGDHFYDYSWHSGISHKQLMADIHVPTIFLHAKDQFSPDGILMAASSDQQARQAVSLIEKCKLIEMKSNHDIHRFHTNDFIRAFQELPL